MQKVKISKRVGRQLYRSSPTILTVVASRNYSSGWTDLYSFCSTGSFNHRMYLWGKRIKSKETSIFDECLCHA